MTPLEEIPYMGYRIETFIEDAPDPELGREVYGFNIFKEGDYEDIVSSGTGYWELRYTIQTAYLYVEKLKRGLI